MSDRFLAVAALFLFVTSGLNVVAHLDFSAIALFGYLTHSISVLLVARYVLGWRRVSRWEKRGEQ